MGKKGKGKKGKAKDKPASDELLNPPDTLELGKMMTIFDVYHEHLRPQMVAHRRRKVTIRDVERHLVRWEEWCAERFRGVLLPVAKIRRKTLLAWRDWLRANGQSDLSCNGHVGTVRQVLLCALRNELIESAPALESLPAQCVAPKIFPSDAQIDVLWDAAAELEWPTINQRGERLPYSPATAWRAWLVMMRTYGFRTQELTRFGFDYRCLTWGEIHGPGETPNPEGRAVCEWGWYRFTPPKQERSKPHPITNPLTIHARAALEHLRPADPQPTDSVFDWPLSSASFYETWHRWMQLAEVFPRAGSGAESFTPKSLRKACTTEHNNHRPGTGQHIVGHAADRSGQISLISDRHYHNAEAAVLDCLMTAPMPSKFDEILFSNVER